MPNYPHLLSDDIPWNVIQNRVDAMVMLGVPYGAEALADADGLAREQARYIAGALATEGGPAHMESKEVIALIAYMQRLGVDIRLSTQGGTK
jgi:cytochrome c oxidase cbb3-type subunit I/II